MQTMRRLLVPVSLPALGIVPVVAGFVRLAGLLTGQATAEAARVASLWHHEYVAHGAWMLRGYALGMGAGTQVLTHLPWFVFVGGTPGEASRAVMMGLAWIINASVAEYVIRTRLEPSEEQDS